jgi:toxin ParE1/3/4
MKYRLIPAAEDDLVGIWKYTAKTWGREQAVRYHHQLETCFNRIAQDRISTKPIVGIPKNLRSARCQHHYVFFIPGDPVIIVAILHEKMDFLSRLANRMSEE